MRCQEFLAQLDPWLADEVEAPVAAEARVAAKGPPK